MESCMKYAPLKHSIIGILALEMRVVGTIGVRGPASGRGETLVVKDVKKNCGTAGHYYSEAPIAPVRRTSGVTLISVFFWW